MIDILIHLGKNYIDELLKISTSKTIPDNDVDDIMSFSNSGGVTTFESIDEILYEENIK